MDVQLQRIKHDLDTLGCSADNFCALADIATSKWSRALRGLVTLSGPEIVRLTDLVRTLQEIARDAAPVPVDFRDLDSVRRLLEHRESKIVWAATPRVANKEE